MGIAKTSLRSGRCQSSWSSSASTSSPSRNRIRISATTASERTKSDSGSNSSTSGAALAEREADEHEQRREREEAALREPGQQRAHDEEAAEHRDGHLERVEVVHGGNLRARWSLGTSWPSASSRTTRGSCAATRRRVSSRSTFRPARRSTITRCTSAPTWSSSTARSRSTTPAARSRRAGLRGAIRPEGAARGARDQPTRRLVLFLAPWPGEGHPSQR